jgi:hypothetical protein
MITLQHAAIRDMRIQRDHPVFSGHQQIHETRCAMRLACRLDHLAVTSTRGLYDWDRSFGFESDGEFAR